MPTTALSQDTAIPVVIFCIGRHHRTFPALLTTRPMESYRHRGCLPLGKRGTIRGEPINRKTFRSCPNLFRICVSGKDVLPSWYSDGQARSCVYPSKRSNSRHHRICKFRQISGCVRGGDVLDAWLIWIHIRSVYVENQ